MAAKVYFTKEITPEKVIERVESRHGVHTIEAAAELGTGTRAYELTE